MRSGQAARYRNFRSERTQHELEWPTTVSPGWRSARWTYLGALTELRGFGVVNFPRPQIDPDKVNAARRENTIPTR
jgi:hypothetical protein